MRSLWVLATAIAIAAAVAHTPRDVRAQTVHPIVSPEASREHWQQALRAALDRRIAAQQRFDAALANYRNMRHRKRKRGESKELILNEMNAAKDEIPIAQRALDDLLRDARRAGVPPGWMRVDPPPARAATPD